MKYLVAAIAVALTAGCATPPPIPKPRFSPRSCLFPRSGPWPVTASLALWTVQRPVWISPMVCLTPRRQPVLRRSGQPSGTDCSGPMAR
jgi:hypothetical protein